MSQPRVPPRHLPADGDLNASAARCPQHWVEPRFTQAARVRVAITAVFFLLAACSNAAVLGSLLRKRRKSHVRPLILSLALADLLVTVAVMPLDAVWNITLQWRAGDLACRLLMYLRLLAMYASAFVTVVISLDRQAAILHPLAIARARRRNRAMLRAAWLLSAALSLPQVPATELCSGPAHPLLCSWGSLGGPGEGARVAMP